MKGRIKNIFNNLLFGACFLFSIYSTSESLAQAPNKIIIYKTIEKLQLHLYLFYPSNYSASDKRTAIVFFHGGGWNNGSPKSFFKQASYLASRGMVAISAQYRLRDSNGTSPKECVEDGKSAIRWIRKNAEELGINPDMIASGGGSAGGQVAAAAATVKGFEDEKEDKTISAKPNALVLFNPVIDNGPDGYGFSKVKEYWKEFSPMHNIEKGTAPTLIMIGTADHLVPVATVQKFKKLMEENGNICELILYENEKHGFFNKSKYNETLLETDKFLTSLGYLKKDSLINSESSK